jgi:ribokinase
LINDLRLKTRVYPIGAVGDDEAARELFEMMKNAGMDMEFVARLNDTPTLHSICFLYPDHSGGNITESRSASSKITAGMIYQVEKILKQFKTIVVAAPEVPLERRIDLINLGFKNHGFILASFVAEEMETVMKEDLLGKLNVLSVNLDEAAEMAGIPADAKPAEIIKGCIKSASAINPNLVLCITCGQQGIYGYKEGETEFLPVLEVDVRNTAGAGDAFLSGIILGIILRFPFLGKGQKTCLKLARLISAMSVTSKDTINFEMNLKNLQLFQKIHAQDII